MIRINRKLFTGYILICFLISQLFFLGGAFAEDNQPSSASYGAVTSKIKKNVTTQEDIVVLLGGPNITTTDAEGSETWIYDKTSSESSQQGKVTGQGAQNTNASAEGRSSAWGVGIPLIVGYGQTKEKGSSVVNQNATVSAQDEVKRTTATKNFTLIIKFNENKTVKTYSVRSANF